MTQEILNCTIKFVAENSESNITNAAALTSDFSSIILLIMLILATCAGIILFATRRFAISSTMKNNHVLNTNNINISTIVFVISLILIMGISIFGITKIANAEENQNKYSITPEVNAYVSQDGKIRFDTAKLEYLDTNILHLNKINVNCNDTNCNNAIWQISINGKEYFNNTVPGQALVDKNMENSNTITFNVEGLDAQTSQSLIGKNVLSLSFDVDEAYENAFVTAPPVGIPDLVYDEEHDGSHVKIQQTLINQGTATGGTLKYFATKDEEYTPIDSDYSTELPQKADAGSYYIWYKAFGDANHGDSTAARLTNPVDIAKADLYIDIIGHTETVTYDGMPHTVQGYDVIQDPFEKNSFYLYKDGCITYGGTDSVTATEVGFYSLVLHVYKFKYNDTSGNIKGHIVSSQYGHLNIVEPEVGEATTLSESSDEPTTTQDEVLFDNDITSGI